jgi:predicted nucleic acid-binding protein
MVRLDLPEAGAEASSGAVPVSGIVLVSEIARVEFHSAIARRRRTGLLGEAQERHALLRFSERWKQAETLAVDGPVLDRAVVVARRHALRSLDAIQLASALVAAEGDPGPLLFGSLDARLNAAAKAEGLKLMAPE